jgi:hypothetical protein
MKRRTVAVRGPSRLLRQSDVRRTKTLGVNGVGVRAAYGHSDLFGIALTEICFHDRCEKKRT